MRRNLPLFAVLSAILLFFSACSKSENPTQPGNTSSFAKLQEKVITKTCVSCHTTGSNYANESGLVLDPPVAYTNLVGVPSHHPNALADGILRVKPGSADSSLLYMKVHGIPQGKNYGSPMPMGLPTLSIGQQEFIRQWINAGAPKSGVVADPALLDDTAHFPALAFIPLDPPQPGTGFQVTTGKFDVPSNFEREIFIYRDLGNTAPIYVNRIKTKMRPNSHHLVLYGFNSSATELPPFDVIRDLRNPDGSLNSFSEMNNHEFLGGSMIQEDVYDFPPGVALQLPAHGGIDMNTHFLNYSGSTISGEAYANFYTTSSANVQHIAQTLFVANTEITLQPQKETVITQTTNNPYPVPLHILMLTSHYHERGKKFQIKISGGKRNDEIIYESTDWYHPLQKNYDTPIIINPGEGITMVVTYFNNTNRIIHYGLTSLDEMAVIYGYLY